MFEMTPRTTPFVDSAANAFFENKVDGDMWCHDIVFLSTLRALMSRKMDQDPHIRIVFPGRFTPSSRDDSTVFAALTGQISMRSRNTLNIVSLNMSKEEADKLLTSVSKVISEKAPGFTEVRKFRDYYDSEKKIVGRYYVNLENRMGILFLDKLSKQRMQVIAMQIPSLLPWFFTDRSSVNDEELELLKSLREPTYDKWLSILQKIAERCDYRKARIRSLLTGFEEAGDKKDIESRENQIANLMSKIEDARMNINAWFNQIREATDMINGIRLRMEQNSGGDSPLMQFFINAQNLEVTGASNRELHYKVKSTVQVYDEFVAESNIDNFRSNIYCNVGEKKKDVQKLLKAVFLDKSLKLRVCASFCLYLGQTLRSESHVSFGADYDTYLPNPHMQYFGCTGGYDDRFDKMVRNGSLAGAVSQSLIALQTINWSDSIVMKEFGKELVTFWNRKVFEKPDGTLVSAEEFTNETKEA